MIPPGNFVNEWKARINVTRSLRDVIKDLQRLERRQRRDHEKTERILWELYVIEGALAKPGDRRPSRPPRLADPSAQGPAPTVQDVKVRRLEGGGAEVILDAARRFKLTRTLAVLAAILAADDGPSSDELVAWKSFDRIASLLEKNLGRRFGHHTVSQLLWRLRVSFSPVSRRLVDSAPSFGARLRLKRRSSSGTLSAGQGTEIGQ